jgi:superfamily I DNA and RNA helicase
LYLEKEIGELIEKLVHKIVHQIDAQGEQVDPRDLLVMSPTREYVEKIAGGLRRAGIRVHVPVKPVEYERGITDPRDRPFFQPAHVTVTTVHSAKGHTAALCHLVGVEQLCATSENELTERAKTIRAELHVAATRASYQLGLWGLPCPLMEEAQAVIDFLRDHESSSPLS